MVAKSYYLYDSQVITQEVWRLKSSHVPMGSICVSGKLRKGKEVVRISMKPFLIATLSDGERMLIWIYCLNALLKFANMWEEARHVFKNSLSKYFLSPFSVLNISLDSGNTEVNKTICYHKEKSYFFTSLSPRTLLQEEIPGPLWKQAGGDIVRGSC